MRILFVDDEELLRECMYETLSDMGHDVIVEGDGQKAVDRFAEDPEGFDLVLTDQVMNGMTGDRASERISSIRPGTPVVVITGTPHCISPRRARDTGIRKILPKPLTEAELCNALNEFQG